ncbi:MAG: 16S rRNA processing protein RimM [Clostridia bacterium]|nr:16S rRNA processing protein RimM [Clostridia bacterium]
MAKQQYLECGRATSTHGVKGTLRLECWCDTPETLARLRTLYRKTPSGEFVPMKVRASAVQKNMVLVTFDGFTVLEDAIPFKGTVFYANRDDIRRHKGDVFVADLIGLPVLDAETGERYGTLADVISPAGRDIYVVDDVRGGQFMIPAVAEFIRETVTEGEREGVYVSLIEGMRE